jgi:hypothetical protein
MQQLSINDLYSRYATGEMKRADFEGNLYTYLFNNQGKTCIRHWKRVEYEDYMSWLYPGLRRAIDSYNAARSSFEAFIHKFIHVSSKGYHIHIITNSVIEYSAWGARMPDLYAHEEDPVYLHEKTENVIKQLTIDKKGRKNTRRILALILKCYNYVSEDFLDKIAPIIGIDRKQLTEMMARIRVMRQKRDDEIYQMKERIHRQYYRCIIYEKRLLLAHENTLIYDKLLVSIKKSRQRLENMRRRMARIRMDATNRQVAEIIGIKKGTVDASLYKLKAKWEIMASKSYLN